MMKLNEQMAAYDENRDQKLSVVCVDIEELREWIKKAIQLEALSNEQNKLLDTLRRKLDKLEQEDIPHLKTTLSVAMNEGERMTKYVEYAKDDKDCMQNEIDVLKRHNATLLDVVRDCVNFLADLNTTAPTDRAKSLHKRAYTAHSKAKSHADTLKGE